MDLFMEIIVDCHTVQVSSVPVLHTERINIEIYYKYDFMRYFILFFLTDVDLSSDRKRTHTVVFQNRMLVTEGRREMNNKELHNLSVLH
jgi:hypothetical protein